MFDFKRTVLAAIFLCIAPGLCAFDLQYGSFFKVSGVAVKNGEPVLPLARKKYANIKVLDRATYDFLKTCPSKCVQPAENASVRLHEIRAAKTRGGMWIADVSFGNQWLVTFLVFENKKGYGVKEPDDFVFVSKKLKKEVQELLSEKAANTPDAGPAAQGEDEE